MQQYPLSSLRQLANIISSSVDKIDAIFQEYCAIYPDPNTPFDPMSPGEELSMSSETLQASALIVAACAQLSATVNVPALTIYSMIGGFHLSSALNVAIAGNVVEILRDKPQGMSVNDIANKNSMDSVRLARVLRVLATHHVFIESSPNVFRNNRLSSLLDTRKSQEEIKLDQLNKHVGTPGMAALLEHTGDEVFKASAFLAEVLLDPMMGHSESHEHTPLAVAFKSKSPPFEWYEEPGNEYRLNRFTAAMEGSARFDPPNAILEGFKWENLPEKATVVDIGGGIGHITLKLIQNRGDILYIIEDRPAVIKQAKRFWDTNFPMAEAEGIVTLMEYKAHDFFTTQPVKGAAIYLLRMILHDYGKKKAVSILRHLRDAACKDSQLLLVEQIVPYACREDISTAIGKDISGAQQLVPPAPLLANFGKASAAPYLSDFQMFCANGGEERTLGAFIDLTESSGWKITEVFSVPGSIYKHIVAIPI
ncbi:O-methyltransferase [Cyathus striatus]|nr:O-methyltransferase [Cyathus striatus]